MLRAFQANINGGGDGFFNTNRFTETFLCFDKKKKKSGRVLQLSAGDSQVIITVLSH